MPPDSDRTFDRQLAYLGLLDNAAPLFREGSSVPGVGILFALPCLVESGLFRIGGNLRAPKVKTLRRRLTRLAAHHCAAQLGAELARLCVDQRGHLMGFLYIDGHVRAYHGQRDISSSAYVARRHLGMPANTDYWINDRSGDPLLVITGEVDAALTKALPRLLGQVRDLVGERRVTIVLRFSASLRRQPVSRRNRAPAAGSAVDAGRADVEIAERVCRESAFY